MDSHAAIDGLRLAYTRSGHGPLLVLLHGWMCNRRFWRNQVGVLSASHDVVALDFRGHGESDAPGSGYTVEQLADDTVRVLGALGTHRPVIVGHSMGGMVAQRLCTDHSRHVSALVLVTTIAADPDDHLVSKRIETDAPRLGFRAAFHAHFDRWFGPNADPDITGWIKTEMLRTREDTALALVRSYRAFDSRAALPRLSLPTLVIGAGADASAVPAESRTLAELIPGARLVMIEHSGHFPMLENSRNFNSVLADFLASLKDER